MAVRQSKAFNALRGSSGANCGCNWCDGANWRGLGYKEGDSRPGFGSGIIRMRSLRGRIQHWFGDGIGREAPLGKNGLVTAIRDHRGQDVHDNLVQ